LLSRSPQFSGITQFNQATQTKHIHTASSHQPRKRTRPKSPR